MTMDEEKLKEIVEGVLNSKVYVSNETHELHHVWVDRQMTKDIKRDLLYTKFKLSFVGAMAIGIASGLVWIGKIVLDAVTSGTQP